MPFPFAEILRGAVELEQTARGFLPHRLPARARALLADPQLSVTESQPSGVRLAFRTGATEIELDVAPTKRAYVGAPPRPDGVYDLVVDGDVVAQATAPGGDVRTVDMATGSVEHVSGGVVTVRFDGLADRLKDVEIWLPWNETTELVDLRADAPVEPLAASGRPVWVHHGSSISHGSDAASPTATWPALAARLGGRELVNLGFAGSALLDQLTARTIRDTSADLISVKIGINIVNTDAMRLRAFTSAVHGFLDTIRDGHPTTPLLVVSPVLCPLHEETPGPLEMDLSALASGRPRFRATGDPAEVGAGKLTLSVIREALTRIVAQRADPNLSLLDGRELYGEDDFVVLPLPDGLHPDAATHQLMGERFASVAFGPGGPLAG
ncbi:lipase [Nocardioides szechwanensis]|uniref:GDSL-like Lipase/Acylhydrolase family protein n=1 Tax=Nocardioides szechwanensis TaxID=1005944 RepID=A0A1G9VE00_9ACTN|nr:SGNH/GDSL hydrolase family protein [Nocardioides szechwanensis]GEP32954.1 lipase [Nocardioides szechwanensis]SDM70303.1 GDSL-like Lipase/Acylhydrolase family protein [Nocardioides szechwanensis]